MEKRVSLRTKLGVDPWLCWSPFSLGFSRTIRTRWRSLNKCLYFARSYVGPARTCWWRRPGTRLRYVILLQYQSYQNWDPEVEVSPENGLKSAYIPSFHRIDILGFVKNIMKSEKRSKWIKYWNQKESEFFKCEKNFVFWRIEKKSNCNWSKILQNWSVKREILQTCTSI